MRYLATVLCVVYLVILTAGLFLPDPFVVAGNHGAALREFYFDKLDCIGHVLVFLPLGFLCCASHWPASVGVRLALATAYALASEPLQVFFPPRTPEWSDLFEDLIGLALGAACWWAMMRWRRVKRSRRGEQPDP